MTDQGAAAVAYLMPPNVGPVIGHTPTMVSRAYGAMGPIPSYQAFPPRHPVGGFNIAGTLQCPDCPEPDCPELPVGVIWSPGGRFGQERP